ncbi:hypothetical protein ADUPG1_007024 [Aduncisulcus paluster]|uniref:Uncharacterized protein n=1 Tax=Aduncisulcus paluster TaxID=2918883 RepID=A0ABQ5KKF3_9EUKA|nr:hypothetical protein ADUPG1_007024 [Aduncisulcus paluster]
MIGCVEEDEREFVHRKLCRDIAIWRASDQSGYAELSFRGVCSEILPEFKDFRDCVSTFVKSGEKEVDLLFMSPVDYFKSSLMLKHGVSLIHDKLIRGSLVSSVIYVDVILNKNQVDVSDMGMVRYCLDYSKDFGWILPEFKDFRDCVSTFVKSGEKEVDLLFMSPVDYFKSSLMLKHGVSLIHDKLIRGSLVSSVIYVDVILNKNQVDVSDMGMVRYCLDYSKDFGWVSKLDEQMFRSWGYFGEIIPSYIAIGKRRSIDTLLSTEDEDKECITSSSDE